MSGTVSHSALWWHLPNFSSPLRGILVKVSCRGKCSITQLRCNTKSHLENCIRKEDRQADRQTTGTYYFQIKLGSHKMAQGVQALFHQARSCELIDPFTSGGKPTPTPHISSVTRNLSRQCLEESTLPFSVVALGMSTEDWFMLQLFTYS